MANRSSKYVYDSSFFFLSTRGVFFFFRHMYSMLLIIAVPSLPLRGAFFLSLCKALRIILYTSSMVCMVIFPHHFGLCSEIFLMRHIVRGKYEVATSNVAATALWQHIIFIAAAAASIMFVISLFVGLSFD